MSAFQPVNAGGLAPDSLARNAEETTPTTPRPSTAPQPQLSNRFDDAKTPTRATFGALAEQRPLPEDHFPATISVPEHADSEKMPVARGNSSHSSKSRDSEDVEMDDSDGEGDGSDEESVNADGSRSSKKKKSQRFWCTDYPPCNLSFTRSEHLARHIRKHTGERPFQCHCSRRFSRLDNLRQHAQTVHVNEEIPCDSLAATGTRFQRQVRTDRVRPPGRSRASTAGSQTSQGRGHHRNSLSASSISSVGSTYSQQDVRRRPPPLVMAADPRSRLSLENYDQHPYRPASPAGFSTPTSATFSTGQNSPRWGSGIQSPLSSQSRTASLYAGHRTPGRRLSVPSGGNPFQSPQSYGPPLLNSSTSGFMSPASSYMASPTQSTHSRRDSISSASDEAWRRRTWHPETTNFTSRLINVTTPSHYQTGPPQQTTRLPGIESFDPLRRPATPPRRAPSPMMMMVDTPSRAPFVHTHEPYEDRRTAAAPQPQWDMGLHRNLTRLEINQNTPTADPAGAWASEANHAVQAQAEHAQSESGRVAPTVRFEQRYPPREAPHPAYYPNHHVSAPPPATPREFKRQGWYNGPIVVQNDIRRQRTSPEDSSSSEGVPGTPGSIYHAESNPGIVHSSSYTQSFAQDPRAMQPMPQEEPKGDSMLRLEALVAVATSEDNATAAY